MCSQSCLQKPVHPDRSQGQAGGSRAHLRHRNSAGEEGQHEGRALVLAHEPRQPGHRAGSARGSQAASRGCSTCHRRVRASASRRMTTSANRSDAAP